MVASISASNSANYYAEQVDHSLYYLTGELGVGIWYGEGAEALGYHGPINPEQLRFAYSGLSPDGTTELVQKQKGKDRQPAWDITFSAPKSVSVLWSVLDAHGRHKIEDLVLQAAKRTIDYLDSEALITRRGREGTSIEHAKGVFGLCPHGTSRAGDQQLHLHCLAINLCRRNDGSTGTIRSKDLYLHKMAAGAIFRLELAYLLQTELGLSISQDTWKFKLDGVSEDYCREQSKRRQTIEAIAKGEGWQSPRVLSELALRTRDPKGRVSLQECFEQWKATAEAFGFTREVAEKLLAAGEERKREAHAELSHSEHNDSQLNKALSKSVEALSSCNAYFPERDLICKVATEAQSKQRSADDVIACVKQGLGRFENRLEKQDSTYTYYSTRRNVAAEKELIDRALNGRALTNHLATEASVEKAMSKVERKLSKAIGIPVTLTEDQKRSLHHITLEPGDLKATQGYAGTGKTQMLEAANLAWKESGYKILGVAITGKAALGLQTATGISSTTVEMLLRISGYRESTAKENGLRLAKTIKYAIMGAYYDAKAAGYWLRNPYKQALREISRSIRDATRGSRKLPDCRLTARSILVVDEAAMLPTKVLLALKRLCDRAGAKLVIVGDRLQLPPIEAGGPFLSLAQRVGYESLTTIIRQRQEWMREAVEFLIKNEPQRALQIYAAKGAFQLAKHQRAAIEKLVDDYGKLRSNEFSDSLALTSTREEARRINEGIQRKRMAARQLGLGSLRLANGERVYKHDRILLTLNDYRLGIRNGLFGTVVKIHRTRGIMGPGSLTIRLDGQKSLGFFSRRTDTITVDLKGYRDVQLGYAATTHKVQGITVKNSFVLLGDSMLNKEMAFTQLTRASHMSTLYGSQAEYGDSIQLLAKDMSRKTQKDLAHDHSLRTIKEQNHAQTLSF